MLSELWFMCSRVRVVCELNPRMKIKQSYHEFYPNQLHRNICYNWININAQHQYNTIQLVRIVLYILEPIRLRLMRTKVNRN